MSLEEMVEKFQCPGCTIGINTKCGKYELDGKRCIGHSAGTFMMGVGTINLGLPKGFNRVVKPDRITNFQKNYTNIRLYDSPDDIEYDHLNAAVWAMEKDGYLFVRVFSPRIDRTFVDIIKGGTMALVPQATDVSKFIDEID